MLVQIAHENGCKKRFDVYCGGQKLKSGEEYRLPADAVLEFTEYNAAAGKLWFLRVFFAFVAGIVRGGFDDFSSLRTERTRIRVRLFDAGDEIFIRFLPDGYAVEGARAEEISRGEEPLPKVKRRIFIYKLSVIAAGLAALAAVIVLIAVL